MEPSVVETDRLHSVPVATSTNSRTVESCPQSRSAAACGSPNPLYGRTCRHTLCSGWHRYGERADWDGWSGGASAADAKSGARRSGDRPA